MKKKSIERENTNDLSLTHLEKKLLKSLLPNNVGQEEVELRLDTLNNGIFLDSVRHIFQTIRWSRLLTIVAPIL